MKSMIATVSVLIGLLLITSFSALAADVPAAADAALGVYQGRLTYLQGNKGAPKDYDFEMEIMSIDASSGKVAIKVTSDFYRDKVVVRKNCQLDSAQPGLVFICKGESWHEDYQVKGDVVKADTISIKNVPYYISATKVKNRIGKILSVEDTP